MMADRKFLRVALTACALAGTGLVSACGGDTPPTTTSQTTTTTTAPAPMAMPAPAMPASSSTTTTTSSHTP